MQVGGLMIYRRDGTLPFAFCKDVERFARVNIVSAKGEKQGKPADVALKGGGISIPLRNRGLDAPRKELIAYSQ